MAHFQFAKNVSLLRRAWLQVVYSIRRALSTKESRKEAAFAYVACPQGCRHPVLVWTEDPGPYERGEIILSECPEDR